MNRPQRSICICLLALVALAGMVHSSWGAQLVEGRDYYTVQLLSAAAPVELQASLAQVVDQPYARIDKRGMLYALRVGYWESREEAERAAKALLPKFQSAYAGIVRYNGPQATVTQAGAQPPGASAQLSSSQAAAQKSAPPPPTPAVARAPALVRPSASAQAQLVEGRDYYTVQLLSAAAPAELQASLAHVADQPYARIDKRGMLYALRVGFWESREEAERAAKALLPKFRSAYAGIVRYSGSEAIVNQASAQLPRASAERSSGPAAAQNKPVEAPIAPASPAPPAPPTVIAAPTPAQVAPPAPVAPVPSAPAQVAPTIAQDAVPLPALGTPSASAQNTVPPAVQTYRPATSLVAAFAAAKGFDPQYRGALAEKTINDTASTVSQLAYTPQLQYTNQQQDFQSVSRSSLSITQPLINGDRFLTYRQAAPRAQLATWTLVQRDQDLAFRLLRSVTELVRAREASQTIEFQISLLKEQAAQAQRLFDLGQGTITDVRDTAVRLAQATASRLAVLTRRRVAENKFAAITGSQLAIGSFVPLPVPLRFVLNTQEQYTLGGQSGNPVIAVSRLNERIAELDAQRPKAALLPTVSVSAVKTETAGISSNFVNLSVVFPLHAQTFAQISGARAQADLAREKRRQAEIEVQLDIERLRSLVESGQEELLIRKDAIVAAELAIQANLKSQQGGVRTAVDVLNSVQTLANVRNEYANTAATLAENYLSLLLQSAYDTAEALAKVQEALFQK